MPPRSAPTRQDINSRERSQWTQLDAGDVPARCFPYTNMDLPIEFIVPHHAATAVGVIDFPASHQDIYDAVASVGGGRSNSFIGIHETPDENADPILSGGFSKEDAGSMTVEVRGVRESAVYTWQVVWDINNTRDDLSGILVAAPRESVMVSDMSAVVTHPWGEYLDDYTMSYPDYIHCLHTYGPVSPGGFEQDFIQDISSYRP